ncbi:hypothetical protein ES703_79046 [subsurface metagenome]
MATYIDLISPAFLALREGLEATLVVVIILLYLKKTNQRSYNRHVYLGAILAIFSSIVFAVVFSMVSGGFTGLLEEIFEGTTFIISGIFIVTLVLWVSKEGPKIRESLEGKLEESIEKQKAFSISFLTYIIIIREGIELVLLLTGTASIGSINQASSIIGLTIPASMNSCIPKVINPALLEIIVYPSLLLLIGFISLKLWKKNSGPSIELSSPSIELSKY